MAGYSKSYNKKKADSPGCGFFIFVAVIIAFQVWSDKVEESVPAAQVARQKTSTEEAEEFLRNQPDDQLMVMYKNGRLEQIMGANIGRTAIHVAAELNRYGLLKSLLADGAPASPRDHKQVTPLHLALEKKSAEAVEVLLKAGADLNAVTTNGYTILHQAARYGFYNVAKAVLKTGANPSPRAYGDFTPLHYAARENHLKIAVLLCENGAETDARISYGWTPGDLAFSKSPEITNYLHSRGALFDQRTIISEFKLSNGWPFFDQKEITAIPDDNNPVFIAVDGDSPTQLARLKSDGVDLKISSKAGTPVLCLAICNNKLQAADFLLKNAPDLESVDANGKNALLYAIENQHENFAREILKKSPNLSHADRSGNTALHYALASSQNAFAVELINRGADLFAENNFARGMIHIASENSNAMMFEVLISNGCDVNQEDINGNTPLHLAVKNDNYPMVVALLKNGADFSVVNNKGKSPLNLAKSEKIKTLLSNRFEIEGQNPSERPKPAEVNILPKSSE